MTDQTYYSTAEAAAMTGASARQVDYWSRTGSIAAWAEANGCGSKRRWTVHQVRTLRVLVVLSALGAQTPVLAEVYSTMAANADWPAVIVVSSEGLITTPDNGWHPSGWVVNLAEAAAYVDHRMAPLAAAG